MNNPALEPTVLKRRQEQTDTICLDVSLDADCPWLTGHFPGRPVLPGVVQLRWAIACAREAWPDLGEVGELSNIKFQNPVLPPTTLELVLQRNRERGSVSFTWQAPDQRFSKGRVAFS